MNNKNKNSKMKQLDYKFYGLENKIFNIMVNNLIIVLEIQFILNTFPLMLTEL